MLCGLGHADIGPCWNISLLPSMLVLAAGCGDEGDTLKDKKVLVYDSDAFPFYPAELYHQFHNDFQGAPYGSAYNALQPVRAKAGAIGETGCPERMF